jgi:hypothetical protein
VSFSLTGRKVTSDGIADAAEDDGFSAMGEVHVEKGSEYHVKKRERVTLPWASVTC